MKTVRIKLTVPEQFYKLLSHVAEVEGESVEEYILNELITDLNCDLEAPLGLIFGMSLDNPFEDYCDQVRDLAYPEEAQV